MKTKPEVFIIESLDPDDEGNGRFEGSIISQILRLHGKEPKYKYVRTKKDFKKAIKLFDQSGYRYLHISTHGNQFGMCTTNLDVVKYDEISKILNPYLDGRRLFLSACSIVHEDIAKEIIPSSRCYSVIGPTEDIDFSDAVIFWSSLYHLMFKKDSDKMSREALKESLMNVTKLYNIDIAYYSKSNTLKRGYTRDLLYIDN